MENEKNNQKELSFPNVSIGNLPYGCRLHHTRKTSFFITATAKKAEDPRQHSSGMTSYFITATTKGFTLIELLVVVLIIGVLSAIALPQFQTAIDKSRYATLMPLAKSVANAQESYYIAAGNYSPDLAYLDVQLPTGPTGSSADIGDGTTVEISNDEKYDYVKVSKNTLENNYVLYQANSTNFPVEIHCEALKGSTRAGRLCETLGGQTKSGSLTAGYDTYILEGTGEGKFPPGFIQNWKAAGIPQETIEKMVDAMTFLKEIAQSRERYYQEHGTYPSNFDQLDINVPQNVRAAIWNGASSHYPDQYMFSCTIQSDHSPSCIANAYNINLPMFQFTYTTYAFCVMYGAKNNTLNNEICSSLPGSVSHGYYYTISDTLEEL